MGGEGGTTSRIEQKGGRWGKWRGKGNQVRKRWGRNPKKWGHEYEQRLNMNKGSHPFHFIESVAWYCSLFMIKYWKTSPSTTRMKEGKRPEWALGILGKKSLAEWYELRRWVMEDAVFIRWRGEMENSKTSSLNGGRWWDYIRVFNSSLKQYTQ